MQCIRQKDMDLVFFQKMPGPIDLKVHNSPHREKNFNMSGMAFLRIIRMAAFRFLLKTLVSDNIFVEAGYVRFAGNRGINAPDMSASLRVCTLSIGSPYWMKTEIS